MLACLQRTQDPPRQIPPFPNKALEPRKCERPMAPVPPPSSSSSGRFPSPAELDAYARRVAGRPLTIKIFPSNVRVPQQRPLQRTVSGYHAMRYGPCGVHSGGHLGLSGHPPYQGLLAVVKPSFSSGNGAVKRTKPSPPPRAAVGPYPKMTATAGHSVQTGQAVTRFSPGSYPENGDCLLWRTSSGAVSKSPDALSLGQWNSFLVTPDSGYNAPAEMTGGHFVPRQSSEGTPSLTSKTLCNASALSASLRSLEYLVNDLRPPCIKERMLGKGYETVAVPRLLDHRDARIRLPVCR